MGHQYAPAPKLLPIDPQNPRARLAAAQPEMHAAGGGDIDHDALVSVFGVNSKRPEPLRRSPEISAAAVVCSVLQDELASERKEGGWGRGVGRYGGVEQEWGTNEVHRSILADLSFVLGEQVRNRR